jgi:hypothetical protein
MDTTTAEQERRTVTPSKQPTDTLDAVLALLDEAVAP